MELLAPAGSFEAMRAAVHNGADAVYFGGNRFNARRFADNFDDEQLIAALDYCHMHNVKAHITLNTLLLERELSEALDYAGFLYSMGADALIVQDYGFALLLRQAIPDLEIHCSTQMAIHDLPGVALMQRLGFSRVVLSREVPLNEISYIHAHSSMPLEAFVHGAMCVSFSGGCLLSSMAGERSGNRGTCAQPCRKQYQWNGNKGYFLSMADLCMLTRLNDLVQAGICSIKIEGRMKRPEYVALVTRAYRSALDGADTVQLEKELSLLRDLFDRGPFQCGYYDGPSGIRTGAVRKKDEDPELLKQARATYSNENRKNPIRMKLTARINAPAKLTVSALGQSADIYGDIVAVAQKPQDHARWKQQLNKLGDTPFFLDTVQWEADAQAFLSAAALNQLRRSAIAELEKKICSRKTFSADRPNTSGHPKPVSRSKKVACISACVRSLEQAYAAFSAGADEVLLAPIQYGGFDYAKLFEHKPENCRLLLSLPAVLLCHDVRMKIDNILQEWPWDGAQANAIGQIESIRHLPLRLAGAPLNVFNTATASSFLELGFTRICLSPELTQAQLRDMVLSGLPFSLQVYGRTPVMRLLHCPRKLNSGCGHCRGDVGTLIDEGNRCFPMANQRLGKDCLVHLLNCDILDLIGNAGMLPALHSWEFQFWQETANQVEAIIRDAVQSIHGAEHIPIPSSTRGHWNRPVE